MFDTRTLVVPHSSPYIVSLCRWCVRHAHTGCAAQLKFLESVELLSVLALLKTSGSVIEIQCEGRSYTLTFEKGDESLATRAIEAARIELHANEAASLQETPSRRQSQGSALPVPTEAAHTLAASEKRRASRGGNGPGGKARKNSFTPLHSNELIEASAALRGGRQRHNSIRESVPHAASAIRDSLRQRRNSFEKVMSRLSEKAAASAGMGMPNMRGGSSLMTETLDSTILSALAQKAEAAGSKERVTLLGQQLTESDWSTILVKGAKRQAYKEGEAVLREGDTTRALYHLVQGTLRAELALPGASKAVVVGRLEEGDVFGERSLLLGGGASVTLVVASRDAIVVALAEATFAALLASHPKLVSKLYCFMAAYQMRRMIGMDEKDVPMVIVESESAQPADLTTISSNPAFLSIFHRYVCSLGASARNLVDLVDFYVEVTSLVTEIDGLQLLSRVREVFEMFVAPGGPRELECISQQLKAEIRRQIPSAQTPAAANRRAAGRRQSYLVADTGGPALRHVFDVAAKAALRWIEAGQLTEFMKSEHYKYVVALKAKERTPLHMHNFKAVRKLGSGGFGQVIEVVKRDCGKHYAMKVLPKPQTDFAERVKQARSQSQKAVKKLTKAEREAIEEAVEDAEAALAEIMLERNTLVLLHHPLIVNLCYSAHAGLEHATDRAP